MWKDEITLIGYRVTKRDEFGQPLEEVEERTMVQAEAVSITRYEFYSAARFEIAKPDRAFNVHRFEYDGQKVIEHRGDRLRVIRTYNHVADGLELTELTCELQERDVHGRG